MSTTILICSIIVLVILAAIFIIRSGKSESPVIVQQNNQETINKSPFDENENKGAEQNSENSEGESVKEEEKTSIWAKIASVFYVFIGIAVTGMAGAVASECGIWMGLLFLLAIIVGFWIIAIVATYIWHFIKKLFNHKKL